MSTITLEESPATVSTAAVSTVIESTEAESLASSLALFELQATTDKEIARAKNPNLNKFFMLIFFFLIVINLHLMPKNLKGNPVTPKKITFFLKVIVIH